MIDLNKYYISSQYQGASGGSEGRAGFVPKALSADQFKYLRGDGTWQTVTVSATGNIVDGGNSNGADITIGTNDPYTLNLETSGVTRVIVTDTGKVGFGGTPYAKVQYVLEDDIDPPQIPAWDNRHVQWGTGGSQAPGLGMSYSQGDGTVNMAFLEPYVAWRNARMNFGTMSWYSGGTTLGLVQDSSGNIGLNTLTPGYFIDAYSTDLAKSIFTVAKNTGTVTAPQGFVAGDQVGPYVDLGYHRAQIVAPDASNMTPLTLCGGSALMEFYKDSNISAAVSFGMAVPGNAASDDLVFGLYSGSWFEGFRVLGSNGYFGIGTSTPTTKLEVAGTIKARKTEESYQDSVLKILSTESAASANWRGRALIGAEDLTFLMGTYNGIAGLGAHSWTSANTEDGAAWADFTLNPDGNANVYIGGSNWDNSTAIVTVQNSTTKVGIGTTTPNEKLTVSGNISATGTITANTATITGNLATGSNYVVTLALTANQTVNQGADAVINFDPKNDPNNWFRRTAGVGLTARRITPTVPGYYYINYQLHWQPGLSGINNQNNIQIMKSNAGAAAITININQQPIDSSSINTCQMGNAISYFNGSTDYVYFQAYTANTTSQTVVGESNGTWTKVEMFKIN